MRSVSWYFVRRVKVRRTKLLSTDVDQVLIITAEYAQVLKMLGNGRLEALCFDGSKRLAHIRGKLRKKVWINQGDIILLSLRDYQDEKGDVILK